MEEPTTIQGLEKVGFLARRVEAMREAILEPKRLPTLWIGAGFSAKYGRNPTWYVFLSKFLAENFATSHEDYSLIDALLRAGKLDLAVEMLVRKKHSEFYRSIEGTFAKSHSSLPLFLHNWNLHDIITTNYDTLAESCFDKHDVLLPSSGMHALLSSRPKIVKIHGTAAEPNTCVASITNYVRSYDNNLEWYLTNVFQTRTVIFFGSSMNESEPYFDILRMLRANNKMQFSHYCVLAVRDRKEAEIQGKRLRYYGIQTIPYFPDQRHRFVDDLLLYIEKVAASRRRISAHLRYVRTLIEEQQLCSAAVLIDYACRRPALAQDTRCQLIDLLFELGRVFERIAPETSKPDKTKIGRDIEAAILAVGDGFVRSPRTLKGLHNLISMLVTDNEIEVRQTDQLWRMYERQKQQWTFEKKFNYDDGVP
jgi:hypothetical protein